MTNIGDEVIKLKDVSLEDEMQGGASPQVEDVPVGESTSQGGGVVKMLMETRTGPGELDSYLVHPLNFNKSMGLAQLIRGATGFFDSLDLAVFDILIGAVRIWQERRGVVGA